MAGQSPLDNPMAHSMDNDAFHYAGGGHFDIYNLTYDFFGGAFGLTKYMALELVAAGLCLLVFTRFARRINRDGYAKGPVTNILELLLVFIRDQVAVPAIGKHDADRFVPLLWSLFFFILFGNLLGMIPWMGSPTADLGATLALATCVFIVIHGSGVKQLGWGGYAHSIVPPVPAFVFPLMLFVELLGHVIRPLILAFRLFINMLAGHTVLFVLLAFIQLAGPVYAYFIAPVSVFAVVALSFLELFVAFLQAYIFVALSALFIGSAVHPHH